MWIGISHRGRKGSYSHRGSHVACLVPDGEKLRFYGERLGTMAPERGVGASPLSGPWRDGSRHGVMK